ncbi:hypothetical protein C8J56DRAFT_1167471 [Mycena floridula]|nr:hypothetical protein C8J56DRAFT_1167471 [Mycena floridula]
MPPKRQSDDSDYPSTPRKRRNCSDSVQPSPFPSSYSYPYIPSSPKYPPKPIDSPTNPFGRKCTIVSANSLPVATGFGKHVPLRFQYICHDKRSRKSRAKEGPHRIVQVPMNYNFQHLRALIHFLFGGSADQVGLKDDEEEGHLFEVRKRVEVQEGGIKEGEINNGEPWVRLSSARNPYLFKNDWEVGSESESEASVAGDEEWKWQAEEDFTILHVWKSLTEDNPAGIIYHHSARVSVHITVASYDKVTRRKGKGNTPFVFWAVGDVRLCLDDDYEQDPVADLDPDSWNVPDDSFDLFFSDTALVPFSGFYDEQEDDINFSSSPVRTSSPGRFPRTPGLTMSSSPLPPSSSIPSTPVSSTSRHILIPDSEPLPYAAPEFTPMPGPGNRKRLGHMQRRMDRLKRKSMEVMDQADSGLEDADQPAKRPKRKLAPLQVEEPEEEVDELDDYDDEDKENDIVIAN